MLNGGFCHLITHSPQREWDTHTFMLTHNIQYDFHIKLQRVFIVHQCLVRKDVNEPSILFGCVCVYKCVCWSVEQYMLMCVRDINEASTPSIVHFPTSGLSGTATQHNEIKANLKHMSLNCLHTQLNSAWSVKMTDDCVCASKVFVGKGSGSLSLDLFMYVIWCIYKKLFPDNSVHSSHRSCSQIYGGFFSLWHLDEKCS